MTKMQIGGVGALVGKSLTIVLILATIIIGSIGIFTAETRDKFNYLKDIEKETNTLFSRHSGTPWWKEEEDLFVACTIITFFAALANLVFSIAVKDPLDKAFDGFMQFLMGLMVLFSGMMLLCSALTTIDSSYFHLKSDVMFKSPKPGLFSNSPGNSGGGGGGGGSSVGINVEPQWEQNRENYSQQLENSFWIKIIAVILAFNTGFVLFILALVICILPQRLKRTSFRQPQQVFYPSEVNSTEQALSTNYEPSQFDESNSQFMSDSSQQSQIDSASSSVN